MKLSIVTKDNCTQLQFVPIDELVTYWGVAKDYIMSAAERSGEMTEEGILGALLSCNLNLFIVYHNGECVSAGTIAIDTYPAQTVATIVHAGGSLEFIFEKLPEAEAWAKACGADVIRFHGRRGWRKVMPEGYKEMRITMEKKL